MRGSWENSRQLSSRVCITVSNSPNSPECFDEATETRKKVLYCLFRILLSDNSTNEGKCWFFHFSNETDFLDTRSYFVPANQNVRLTTQPIKIRVMSQPCFHTLKTQLLTNESAGTILIIL